MSKFPCSETYRLPAPSTAMPTGVLKDAPDPVPLTDPACPGVPAIVVTTPAGVTLRTEWLPASATYTLPAGSTHTPNGL
jgi:hypothetical protein